MITKLTQNQIDKFPDYVKKWTDIGLCTEKANRTEAEKWIKEAYKIVGLEIPTHIIWCGSPLSQALVRTIILDNNTIKLIIDSVMDSVMDSVWDSVRSSVRYSVMDSVIDSVRSSVWNSVRDSVMDSVIDSVRSSVRYSVRDSVMDSVWDSVRSSVWNSVWDSVRSSVWNSVWDSVIDSLWDSGYGNHDASWLAFYDFLRNECGLVKQTNKIFPLLNLAQHAGWYLPHKNICWISERHIILNRDERGRLHSMNAPAVVYPDGWKIYAVHGVRIPEKIIMSPDQITISEIENESNAEIRRIMIDQYDIKYKGKYLLDSGAKIIDKDKDQFGKPLILYKKEINDDEPIVMIKMINSTPEPDNSFKEYFLRVPPDIKKAKEAIAWTFNVESENYNPIIET